VKARKTTNRSVHKHGIDLKIEMFDCVEDKQTDHHGN